MSSEPGDAPETEPREVEAALTFDVHRFHVAPKKRTREAIAVLVTLAALFLLLFLLVGHPAAPQGLLHPHRPMQHAAPTSH